jgi:hypothetical protein
VFNACACKLLRNIHYYINDIKAHGFLEDTFTNVQGVEEDGVS